MAIFPGTSIMYNMLKTCGDLKYGILTQGVEERNVNKMQDQTLSNILLKINTKLGGRNWLLSTQNRLFAQYLNNLYDGMHLILQLNRLSLIAWRDVKDLNLYVYSSRQTNKF